MNIFFGRHPKIGILRIPPLSAVSAPENGSPQRTLECRILWAYDSPNEVSSNVKSSATSNRWMYGCSSLGHMRDCQCQRLD